MKLIYVSPEYSGSVVEGQVYKLLDYYLSKGWFNEIVLLQSYNSYDKFLETKQVLKNHNFQYKLFYSKPWNPFKVFKTKRELSDLLNNEINECDFIVHTRTTIMAFHACYALEYIKKPLNVLADERGAIFYELKYKAKKTNNIIYKIKSWLQYSFFLYCYRTVRLNNIQISTVSFSMKELLVKNKFLGSNISVHPNIASDIFVYNEELRYNTREKLGISKNESLVILSSGEGGLWQNDIETIDILLKQNVKILNLSKKEINKQGVINLFIPHNEMPYYLSAADVAILWRENEVLNNVACPSKFGEFVVMGLYVIHNKTVDIATKYIKENHAGLLVDEADEIRVNNDALYYQLERQRRIESGRKIFSVEEIAKSYYKKYISIYCD
ncbi:MAG TPA: glycosyltransferase family 4 protein [Bacteroidales bacterium]|nr:glycosyltransferase family 4 protein [Bacteroidales bacterium]